MSDDHADLAARLRRMEDLDAIRQLFIDYGAYLDRGDLDAYAALFDEEEGEVLLGPIGRAKGREGIKDVMAKTLSVSGHSYHLVTSPQIQLDGDRATAQVMWTVVVRQPDGTPAVTMLGFHHDKLIRRDDGRWYFHQRRGSVEIPSVYSGSRPEQ
jgi:uncharacterized protein (TIGR02246 family)